MGKAFADRPGRRPCLRKPGRLAAGGGMALPFGHARPKNGLPPVDTAPPAREHQGFTRTQCSPAMAFSTRASTFSLASASRTSSSLGRVQGWRGVNTVQQSS